LTELRPSLFDVWQPFISLTLAVLLGLALAVLPLPLVGAMLAATAVLLLVFLQPLLGLALTLMMGPLGALENVVLGQTLLDSGQLLLLITLTAWLARGLLHGRIVLAQTFLNAPLALFVYVAALSLAVGVRWNIGTSAAPSLEFGLKELLKWLEIGAVMLLVVDLASGPVSEVASGQVGEYAGERVTRPANPQTRKLAAMLLLAGLSQALIGIWQFGLRGHGPEHFLVLGRFYRAYGTFEQPNPFGGFMNLTVLLGVGTLLGVVAATWRSRGAGERGKATVHCSLFTLNWRRVGWILFVGLCTAAAGLALLFSWSRGAWLGFAVAGIVLVLFWPKKRWQGVVLLAAAAVLFGVGLQVGVVPATVSERLSGFNQDLRFGDVGDLSFGDSGSLLRAGGVAGVDINDANYAVLERLAHWQAALDMARDNLWLGVGFGNYEPAYDSYALINWPYPLGHAHNIYLNILAEAGIIGLVAYLLFWAAVFWQTVRLLTRLDWPQRGLALGLLAAWVALSVHHLVDKLYVNNVYIHLGVMLGLLQLLEKQAESHIHNNDVRC
jgi:O-antigen ligase